MHCALRVSAAIFLMLKKSLMLALHMFIDARAYVRPVFARHCYASAYAYAYDVLRENKV